MSDTEAEEEAKIEQQQREQQPEAIIEPPPELKDNSQPWWDDIMKFVSDCPRDEKKSDSDTDDPVADNHARKRVVRFKKLRKERPVREHVTIYQNKQKDPKIYFDDPTHRCKPQCWKQFDREAIITLRDRWWYQGIATHKAFKVELLTSKATGRLTLDNKSCCVKCAAWVLCISVSQLYPPTERLPEGVPRVRILPDSARKEAARAWYVFIYYIHCRMMYVH